MPARMLEPSELQRCVDAIATRHPERPSIAPGPADYDVLDSERYCRVSKTVTLSRSPKLRWR